MFRIQSAHRQPSPRPTQAVAGGRFRTSQDFSVKAYKRFNADRARAFLPNAARALGRRAGSFLRHLLEAMHESRRKQAMVLLARYADLMNTDAHPQASVCQNSALIREPIGISSRIGGAVDQAVYGMRIRCSITGSPCEGDRAYLCGVWGCARKGGLSPISHENV